MLRRYLREWSAWTGLFYRIRFRAGNRWMDMRAVLAGYCNHRPWNVPGEGGGYSHWRCAHKRGHDGLHRSRNYVWTDDGRTDYVPIDWLPKRPRPADWADQPWERHVGLTLRQQRRMNRWHRERVHELRSKVNG